LLEARLPEPFRAVFTTRVGTHVGGRYGGTPSTLNLDPRSEDDSHTVAENRAWLADIAGRRAVSPAQAHGVRVVGASEYLEEPEGTPCDGLTIHPDIDGELAALLLFADCLPIVLCSEVDLAVLHAGWRGLLAGVVQQGGRSLMGGPGTAIIGPSIGPCCFTVEGEVADAFAARFGRRVVVGGGDGSSRVDLWEAATVALEELGIPRGQVVNPRLCTACNTDVFFSYRREGPRAGRQGCMGWTVSR